MMSQQEKNEVDWEAVFWEYFPRILGFFRWRARDDDVAKDLTSKTFEQAWKARERYDSKQGSIGNWLYTIAKRLYVDYLRSTQNKVVRLDVESLNLTGFSALRPVEDAIQRQESYIQLDRLIQSLSEREREILDRKYFLEQTNREIAAALNMGESNVGTILNRIRQDLRLKSGGQ